MSPPPDYALERYPESGSGTDSSSTSHAGGTLTFSSILARQAERLPISDAMVREAGGEMGAADLLSTL